MLSQTPNAVVPDAMMDAVGTSFMFICPVFFKLTGLPSILKAAAIHSNMSKKQRETAIEKVSNLSLCL